jgi:c-di-GMP phosphodiesterase
VHDVLVARQPIYDRSLRVVAYELLLQHGDEATAELGLNLVGGQLAYIPVSRAFLVEGYARALPADRVMLKVPRELDLDAEVVDELRALKEEGYRLVVEGPRLLDLATIIAVDITSDERRRMPAGDAMLLAQNVEDHDALEFCRAHGFELLQGYFFCTPREIHGRPVQVNLLNRVKLAATLQSPEVQLEEIERVITRDVALSYNLLRFINSAFFSLPRRVDSIRDALVLLGVENVRRWATLMAIADADAKPRELVVTGLVRARLCELLAHAYAHDDPDAFFTAGLFSVVDALTDTSMIELLRSIPLSQELIAALLNHEGAKGRILHSAIAYERGRFSELADLPPTHPPLSDLYGQAVAWATASGELL